MKRIEFCMYKDEFLNKFEGYCEPKYHAQMFDDNLVVVEGVKSISFLSDESIHLKVVGAIILISGIGLHIREVGYGMVSIVGDIKSFEIENSKKKQKNGSEKDA